MSVPAPAAARIPTTVWILGFVSLLMDVSSEMIQTLLPLYMVAGLGVSAFTVGVIEGLAVAVAMGTRLFAGTLSDRLGNRKWLTVLGYGLGALAKPLFPLAESAGAIFGGRFLDRVGKGIRSAPRDALIADVTSPALRSRSFGLRKSLDTVGGFVGPLLAIGLMLATADDFRTVFWIATVPAFLAVLLLVVGIREPARGADAKTRTKPPLRDAFRLDAATWLVIGIAAAMSLARFSEAFLLLRAEHAGIAVAWVPLVMVGMHLVYGGLAYPVGVAAERVGRAPMLLLSMLMLVGANLALARADTLPWLALGVALWGAHMGFSQGVLAALLADRAPAPLRGSAFGMLSLVTGIAALLGNLIAGGVWTWVGPSATFLVSAAVTAIALLGLVTLFTARGHRAD